MSKDGFSPSTSQLKNNLNDSVSLQHNRRSQLAGYLHTFDEPRNHSGHVGARFTKDSTRFDLKSFKALGGAYAVAQLVNDEKKLGEPSKLTVTTAA